MRNLYETKVTSLSLQQGSIINHCYAELYDNREVYGLIITPRCDLENEKKVSTIHYLPIVKYADWCDVHLQSLCDGRILGVIRKKLNSLLKTNRLDDSIIDTFAEETLITELKNNGLLKSPPLSEFEELFNDYRCVRKNVTKRQMHLKYLKSFIDSKITELIENKINSCYLIEDWEDSSCFKVVLLRDVRRITYDVFREIPKGLKINSINNPDTLQRNDISITHTHGDLIEPKAQIRSPYVEHIIQSFFIILEESELIE